MPSEEELSQMTPEQLAEFQKQNCVFCQISAGRVPARTVYSDSESLAVLDIHPAAKGHMLLMPREHYSVMPQLPEHLAEHLFMVCKGLSQAALKALHCKGTTIFIANGVAAGQRAPHFMMHIIPRNDGDGLSLGIPERNIPKQESDAVNAALKKALGMKGNIAEAEIIEEKPASEDKKREKAEAKKKTPAKKKGDGKKFDLDSVAKMLAK